MARFPSKVRFIHSLTQEAISDNHPGAKHRTGSTWSIKKKKKSVIIVFVLTIKWVPRSVCIRIPWVGAPGGLSWLNLCCTQGS